VGEFDDYDRRHPCQRELIAVLRKHEDADPLVLARTAVEAVFDLLVSPPMLDTELPTEDEVDQVEDRLIALVNEVADQLRALIHHPRPDDAV
jgi:hypothetical protein